MKHQSKKWIFVLLLLATSVLYAASGFIVKRIEIQGLHGISSDTVLSYMPVHVGDQFDVVKSNDVISALYQTGFFQNILLSKNGQTLVVQVKQRPIISRLRIEGNKLISSKNLYKGLKSLNFVEGRVYDKSILDTIKNSLLHEYTTQGRYNAKIRIQVKKVNAYKVDIKIHINEGAVAKIKEIKIIGNHAFKTGKLLDQFKLSTGGIFSFFTHDNQYSKEKLAADLESLRSFYMNRGYLRFKILSHQVSIDPDKKHVYIVIRIQEGGQYKVNHWHLTGRYILPKKVLEKQVTVKSGHVFVRQDVMDSVKNIQDVLGNKGYGRAKVNAIPSINDRTKQVSVNFQVIPGRRLYVRRVIFEGNYRTNDQTLRRNLEIQEGSMLSTSKVQKSKRFLLLLPYISNVNISTQPVAGTSNQEDLIYHVTERSAASISGGIGYSELDKFGIHAALNHQNVFGTGNSLSLNASKSSTSLSASVDYYNPFYTKSGIGRDISFYANKFDADKANISNYSMDSYGASLGYNFRISENNSLNTSIAYENDILRVGSTPSRQLKRFIKDHGRNFYQAILNGGWSYQGLDRTVFPTMGWYDNLGLTLSVPLSPQSKDSLEYYKADFSSIFYHPIYKKFIGQARIHLGYGAGYGRYTRLPFIKNFYAGGMGSVRGYEGNTLGPKDSNADAMGGNMVMDGTLGLVFPNPMGNNVRTTWFFDYGNVFDKSTSFKLKTSTGVEVDWLSPMGMLNFVLSKAINANKNDDTRVFDFSIGASL